MSGLEMQSFEDLECYAATDKALLVGLQDDEQSAVWLPRSQIETDMDAKGDVGSCEIPQWLVDDKGIDW